MIMFLIGDGKDGSENIPNLQAFKGMDAIATSHGPTDILPNSPENILNDDHPYTQSADDSPSAINKQLSNEHSYISSHITSPTVRGISLLQPRSSSESNPIPPLNAPKVSAPVNKSKAGKKVNDMEVVEQAVANIPGMDVVAPTSGISNIKFANTTGGNTNIETDVYKGLDEPISIDANRKKSSANYVCFFSLIRDLHRSSPNHKIAFQSLEEAVQLWQETERELDRSSSGSSCTWLSKTDSWVDELSSSIAFLLGAFPNEYVPGSFSPFVKCDADNELYEWIGTGRDSDVNLMALTQWWSERKSLAGRFILPGTKEHREEMMRNQESDTNLSTRHADDVPLADYEGRIYDSISHPNVNEVEPESKLDKGTFHSQERQRMENPGHAFTYHYPAVKEGPVSVGPVRTNLNINQRNNKVKPHPLLLSNRPPWVTMIVLVQDALARMPNGEGSKSDICKYVTHSRYCNLEGVADNPTALTTVVSGALDRLQGETDPCCKYYTDRKIWRYLHKGRSEEEFMRRHGDKTGNSSTKSATPPKNKNPSPIQKSKMISEASSIHLHTADNLVENANAVNSILPAQSDLPLVAVDHSLILPSTEHIVSKNNSVLISTPSITANSISLRPATQQLQSNTSTESSSTSSSSSIQTLKIMTPQGLKTVSLAPSNKTVANTLTPNTQQQTASVLRRNITPSFSMSSTNPQPSHGTISSAKPGQQIQIQIQQAPQHKNDPAEHQQIHRPTLLRPIKTNLTIPGVSVGGSHKTIQRTPPQSILHISSK